MLTYYIFDYDEGPDDAHELKQRWERDKIPSDPECFAEKAAEYCHSYRDGWEWSWPIVVVVLDDKVEVGRYEVDRQMVPEFIASKVKT